VGVRRISSACRAAAPRSGNLPWQRLIGAGGQIKLKFEAGLEQLTRLEMEGVRFIGKRVDIAAHQRRFRAWEFDE
jgi:methylated-DNA-protein-cysteine methyltransferase related protein